MDRGRRRKEKQGRESQSFSFAYWLAILEPQPFKALDQLWFFFFQLSYLMSKMKGM